MMDTGSRVAVLDSCALVSRVVQYYAPTHPAFLLLSRFSRKAQHQLDQYYTAFIRTMATRGIEVDVDDIQSDFLYLPADLFTFNVILSDDDVVGEMLEFITMLYDKQGYYFNTHYMHKIFRINDVLIKLTDAESLLTYQQ